MMWGLKLSGRRAGILTCRRGREANAMGNHWIELKLSRLDVLKRGLYTNHIVQRVEKEIGDLDYQSPLEIDETLDGPNSNIPLDFHAFFMSYSSSNQEHLLEIFTRCLSSCNLDLIFQLLDAVSDDTLSLLTTAIMNSDMKSENERYSSPTVFNHFLGSVSMNKCFTKKVLLYEHIFKTRPYTSSLFESITDLITFKNYDQIVSFFLWGKGLGWKVNIEVFKSILNQVHKMDATMYKKVVALSIEHKISQEDLSIHIMKVYVKAGSVSEAFDLYLSFESKKHFFDDRVLITELFTECVYTKKVNTILKLSKDATLYNYKFEPPIVLHLIRGMIAMRPENAAQLYYDIKGTDPEIDAQCVREIVDSVMYFDTLTNARKFLDKVRLYKISISPRAAGILMKEYIRVGRVGDAVQWIKDGPSSIEMVHELMRILINSKEYEDLSRVFKSISDFGVKPNTDTYLIMISSFLSKNDMPGARTYTSYLLKAGTLLPSQCHSPFLDHLLSTGKWKSAMDIWRRIQTSDFQDESSLLMVRSLAARKQDIQIQHIEKALDPQIHPRTMYAILHYNLSIGMLAQAERCFKSLKGVSEKNILVLSLAKAAFINYYARYYHFNRRTGDFKRAEQLSSEYLQEFGAHSRAFLPLIQYSAELGRPITLVTDYWAEMQASKVLLDTYAFEVLFKAFFDSKKVGLSSIYFVGFQALKLRYSPNLHAIMMEIHGAGMRVLSVEEEFYQATRMRLGANSKNDINILLNGLASGYGLAGQWERCLAIWNRLWLKGLQTSVDSSLIPDDYPEATEEETIRMRFGVTRNLLTSMIQTLGRSGELAILKKLWKQITRASFPINQKICQDYVHALCRCNKATEALHFMLSMESTYFVKLTEEFVITFLELTSVGERRRCMIDLVAKYPHFKGISLNQRELLIVEYDARRDKKSPKGSMQDGYLVIPGAENLKWRP